MNRDYGILPKYAGAHLDGVLPDAPKLIQSLCAKTKATTKKKFFSDNFNVYLFGSVRVGKTWCFHAILNHIKDGYEEHSVYYIVAPKLVGYYQTNAMIDEDTSWVNYLASRKVLIIDDIGQEHRASSGFAETKIENFIRWRINNNKITYLGSNASIDMLSKIYGESFAEIVRGEFVQIEVNDVNFSQQILNRKLGMK